MNNNDNQDVSSEQAKKALDTTASLGNKAGRKVSNALRKTKLHRKMRVLAKKAKRKVVQAFVKLIKIIFHFLLQLLISFWWFILILVAIVAIGSYFVNNDVVDQFLNVNLQMDQLVEDSPFNLDRNGNYSTNIKELSKGNKMYFVYYAYNAQKSAYASVVGADNKPINIPGSDKYHILGLGFGGGKKLVSTNDPLYQASLEPYLIDSQKKVIQDFTMNTTMLYLFDNTMHRSINGEGRDGFYFTEQFIRPMYTDDDYNYSDLWSDKYGFNSKSWQFDPEYDPNLERDKVIRRKGSGASDILRNPTEKDMAEPISKEELKKNKNVSPEYHGDPQYFYLYKGAKNSNHPYPYKTTDGKAPNTDTGDNIKKVRGAWNYGFAPIFKFKQYEIDYGVKPRNKKESYHITLPKHKEYYLVGVTAPVGTMDLTNELDKKYNENKAKPLDQWKTSDMKHLNEKKTPDGQIIEPDLHATAEDGHDPSDVISDAPDQLNSKDIDDMIKVRTQGANGYQKDIVDGNIFGLHGTQYFSDYLEHYKTYIPSQVTNTNTIDLAQRYAMFEHGTLYSTSADKKEAYQKMEDFFNQQLDEMKKESGETTMADKNYDQIGGSQAKWEAAQQWKDLANKYGKTYGIDPDLILAIIAHESGGKAGASNPSSSAYGLMQVLAGSSHPSAYNFETHSTDSMSYNKGASPDIQVKAGTMMLAQAMNSPQAHHNVALGLMVYADGTGGVEQYFLSKMSEKPEDITPEQIAKYKDPYGQSGFAKEVMSIYGGKGKPYFMSKDGKKYELGNSNGVSSGFTNLGSSIADTVKGLFKNLDQVGKGIFSVTPYNSMGVESTLYDYFPEKDTEEIEQFAPRQNGQNLRKEEQLDNYLNYYKGKIHHNPNSGAKMMHWKSYDNHLSQDEFMDFMRSYIAVLQTSNGRKTNFDQSPDNLTDMDQALNLFYTKQFLSLYKGTTSTRDQTKKVIETAFGTTEANLINGSVPKLSSADSSKDMNAKNSASNETIASQDHANNNKENAKKDPQSNDSNKDADKDGQVDYSKYNNKFNPFTKNTTLEAGNFNGYNVMLETSPGQPVGNFAPGTVSDIGQNSISVTTRGATAYYTNLIPRGWIGYNTSKFGKNNDSSKSPLNVISSKTKEITSNTKIKVGDKVKAGEILGVTIPNNKLTFGLQVPNGRLAQMDLENKTLAKAVKYESPEKAAKDAQSRKNRDKDSSNSDAYPKDDSTPQETNNEDGAIKQAKEEKKSQVLVRNDQAIGQYINPEVLFTQDPSSADGQWGSPLVGVGITDFIVTSGWGDRTAQIGGAGTAFHQGWDVDIHKSKQVAAVDDGKVIYAGYSGVSSVEYVIIIDHGYADSYYQEFGSQIIVKKGDTVKKGQAIANLAGATHLHYGAIDKQKEEKYIGNSGYPMPPIPPASLGHPKSTPQGWLDPAQFYGMSEDKALEFNKKSTSPSNNGMTLKGYASTKVAGKGGKGGAFKITFYDPMIAAGGHPNPAVFGTGDQIYSGCAAPLSVFPKGTHLKITLPDGKVIHRVVNDTGTFANTNTQQIDVAWRNSEIPSYGTGTGQVEME